MSVVDPRRYDGNEVVGEKDFNECRTESVERDRSRNYVGRNRNVCRKKANDDNKVLPADARRRNFNGELKKKSVQSFLSGHTARSYSTLDR